MSVAANPSAAAAPVPRLDWPFLIASSLALAVLVALVLIDGQPAAAALRARLEALHAGMENLARSANQLLALARADRFEEAQKRAEAARKASSESRTVAVDSHARGSRMSSASALRQRSHASCTTSSAAAISPSIR